MNDAATLFALFSAVLAAFLSMLAIVVALMGDEEDRAYLINKAVMLSVTAVALWIAADFIRSGGF